MRQDTLFKNFNYYFFNWLLNESRSMDISREEDHEFAGSNSNPIGGRKLSKGDILFHREWHVFRELCQRLPAHPLDSTERDLDVDVFAVAFSGNLRLRPNIDLLDIHEGLAIRKDFVSSQRKSGYVIFFKPLGDFLEARMEKLVMGELGEGVVNHR